MGEYQPSAYANLFPVASPNDQSLHQQRAGTQLNSKTLILYRGASCTPITLCNVTLHNVQSYRNCSVIG